MQVVALISGGKDSFYNALECARLGPVATRSSYSCAP